MRIVQEPATHVFIPQNESPSPQCQWPPHERYLASYADVEGRVDTGIVD